MIWHIGAAGLGQRQTQSGQGDHIAIGQVIHNLANGPMSRRTSEIEIAISEAVQRRIQIVGGLGVIP